MPKRLVVFLALLAPESLPATKSWRLTLIHGVRCAVPAVGNENRRQWPSWRCTVRARLAEYLKSL